MAESIYGSPEPISAHGRVLVHRGDVHDVAESVPRPRHLALFNDIIVIARESALRKFLHVDNNQLEHVITLPIPMCRVRGNLTEIPGSS